MLHRLFSHTYVGHSTCLPVHLIRGVLDGTPKDRERERERERCGLTQGSCFAIMSIAPATVSKEAQPYGVRDSTHSDHKLDISGLEPLWHPLVKLRGKLACIPFLSCFLCDLAPYSPRVSKMLSIYRAPNVVGFIRPCV